jgi:hypothetical protein
MPVIPIGPPVTWIQLSKTRKRISPNPRVVKAKYTPRSRREGYPIRNPKVIVTRTAIGNANQKERASLVMARAEA